MILSVFRSRMINEIIKTNINNNITRLSEIQDSGCPGKVCQRLRDVSLASFQSLLFPKNT